MQRRSPASATIKKPYGSTTTAAKSGKSKQDDQDLAMFLFGIVAALAFAAALIAFVVFGIIQGGNSERYHEGRNAIDELRQELNALEAELNASQAPIGFSAYKAVAQSIPPGFNFITGWATTAGRPAYDATAGGFNNLTGLFTASIAAKYQCTASLCWSPGASGAHNSVFITNGTPLMATFDAHFYFGTGFDCNIMSVIYDFAPGNTLRILVAQGTGSVQTMSTLTTFSVERIAIN